MVRKIILTFDDNKWNHYNTVLPLLIKYNMVGTFAYISRDTFGPKESNGKIIKEILSYGNEICSHTHTHIWLDTSKNDLETIINDFKCNKKIMKSFNLDDCGLITPFNHLKINKCYPLKYYNYVVYKTSTIDNYEPNPENKLLKFTTYNELNNNNLRRIKFPIDGENNYKARVLKFYEIIKNLDDDEICVVMFHNISDHIQSINVKIKVFEDFLKFLKENNFKTITIKDLYSKNN